MRNNSVSDTIIPRAMTRGKKDIRNWRAALIAAENINNPRRTLLYNLYHELILDPHLSSEIQKRVLASVGAEFSLYKIDDGESDPEITALFHKPWFYEFIEHAINSVFWGFSVVELGDIKDGEIDGISLIPRKHILPLSGEFIKDENENRGIKYRDDDKYSRYIIEIGKTDDLGLINKAAPQLLYKRFSTSAWSDFTEIFGMPLRVAKTNTKDRTSLNAMEDMMVKMGSGGYAIIDESEMLEFIESNKSNGDVYKSLIDLCNSEISKLINGAVIGEANAGGSRAKEEVGERTGNMIWNSDKQMLTGYINEQLIPKLIDMGYKLDGYGFRFEKHKDLDAMFKMAQGLLQSFDIDAEYISNTFGIPVSKKETVNSQNLNTEGDFFA